MEELIKAYRNTFNSPDGELVLADILSMLGHFANDPSRIEPHCMAVAHTILARLGAYSADGTRRYVKKVIESGFTDSVPE